METRLFHEDHSVLTAAKRIILILYSQSWGRSKPPSRTKIMIVPSIVLLGAEVVSR